MTIDSLFKYLSFMLLYLLVFFSININAQELTVAVASNFQPTLNLLKKEFELEYPHQITIASGSTGKLYAQIIHGSPFDIFMSADKVTPILLEKNNLAIKNSRMTYAIGRLVLWSADPNLVDLQGKVLLDKNIHRIAMANPKLAPYGQAADEFLKTLNSDKLNELLPKLIKVENISQAFHLVANGSAEIGFVALSQITNPQKKWEGSHWLVPESLHQPIEQQVIQLKQNPASDQFIQFLSSPRAIKIIQSFGYQVLNNSIENKGS